MSSSGELRDPLRCTRGMHSSGLTDLSINVTANIHNYAKFKAICKGKCCKALCIVLIRPSELYRETQ